MSRTANPYDNALAERLPGASAPALRAASGRLSRSAQLVATLKTECFGDALPPSLAAELLAFDYIETFYNRHSSLGYRSPLDFEKQMFPQQKTWTSTSYQQSKPRLRGKISPTFPSPCRINYLLEFHSKCDPGK